MGCSKSKSCTVQGKSSDCCWHDCREYRDNTAYDYSVKVRSGVWDCNDCSAWATYSTCAFW